MKQQVRDLLEQVGPPAWVPPGWWEVFGPRLREPGAGGQEWAARAALAFRMTVPASLFPRSPFDRRQADVLAGDAFLSTVPPAYRLEYLAGPPPGWRIEYLGGLSGELPG